MARARSNGEGSLYQRHDHVSCPKVGPNGERPQHRCRGHWVGAVTLDSGKRAVFYGATKADVKVSIKQAQARMDVGAPAKDAKTLLSAVVTEWIASTLEASDLKASTKVTYATLLRSQVLTDDMASKPLADIKPSHVEQLTVRMRVKGCSPSTVRQTYTVLRSVLETAVRDELLASNPAARVKRPGVPRKEAHYLSIAEVASLLEEVKDSRYAPLLRLLVATGLRRGEALALGWSDVDLTNSLLRVRGTLSRANGHLVISEPKTERSRRDVPLSPPMVALLRSVKASQAVERLKAASIWAETGLVFTTERGTAIDPRNALRAINAAARALGMSGVGLHTLRHSFATHMLAVGVPLHTVSELLGHSSVAVTGDVYGHVSTEGARSAIQRLSTAMGW